jgi:hypothetical protein
MKFVASRQVREVLGYAVLQMQSSNSLGKMLSHTKKGGLL